MAIGRRIFLKSALQAGLLAMPVKAISETQGRVAVPSPARLPAGAVSRFVRANGIDMHAIIAGKGPPVVLLHGWPQTSYAWNGVIARLSHRFTLIAPDLRGTGLSERTESGYDKRTIAADIAALIAELAGGKAHLVGHDMGGKAAFVLAQLHPGSIERLVLVDCSIPGTENADALRGGLWHYGFHAAPDFPEMLTQGREREYIRAQIRAWSHRKEAIGDEAIDEYARHYARAGGMRAGFAYYRALPEDAALTATFADKGLAMPVLAVGGRHSVSSRLAEALTRHAGSVTSVVVEESGHFVPEEAPDALCEALLSFLPG